MQSEQVSRGDGALRERERFIPCGLMNIDGAIDPKRYVVFRGSIDPRPFAMKGGYSLTIGFKVPQQSVGPGAFIIRINGLLSCIRPVHGLMPARRLCI